WGTRRFLHGPRCGGYPLHSWENSMSRISPDSRSKRSRLGILRKQRGPRANRRSLPQLEALEARCVPTTITLTPSKDNTLYESTVGDVSNGAGTFFFVGQTNGSAARRGVMAFNLAAIPAGSQI